MFWWTGEVVGSGVRLGTGGGTGEVVGSGVRFGAGGGTDEVVGSEVITRLVGVHLRGHGTG